jgi:hypothetical protein
MSRFFGTQSLEAHTCHVRKCRKYPGNTTASPLGNVRFTRSGFGEFFMPIPPQLAILLKKVAAGFYHNITVRLDSFFAPKEQKAQSLTVGDNNNGNIYIFHGPVNITQSSAHQLTTDSPSRPSTKLH